MTEEVIAHRSRVITGFTLFWSDSKFDSGKGMPRVPGWQMNVRRKGEQGWDCKQITEEQAAAILSMLETSGHPDGPWTVKQREVWASLDGPKIAEIIQASKYNKSWEQVQADAAERSAISNAVFAAHIKPDPYLEGIRNRERFAATEGFDYERFLAEEAGLIEPPTIDELVANWKAAVVENTEARNVAG